MGLGSAQNNDGSTSTENSNGETLKVLSMNSFIDSMVIYASLVK